MLPAPESPTALLRLTEREKDCLRRWLAHRTAKEIALELGISPHAVEKRLKMARLKLGVASSLEAARLLDAADRYGRAGPHPPDLSQQPAASQTEPLTASAATSAAQLQAGASRRLKGATIMGFTSATLLLLALYGADGRGPAASAATDLNGEVTIDGTPAPTRKAGMCEVGVFLKEDFLQKDADHTGYLEVAEIAALEPVDAASRDRTLPAAPQDGGLDTAAIAKWRRLVDRDRDDRLSQDEYVGYMMPWMLWQGLPTIWPGDGTGHCPKAAAAG